MKPKHSIKPQAKPKQKTSKRKNQAAQRLIKMMEKPPHLTDEDIEVLNQSIEEGKIPINDDFPFELEEPERYSVNLHSIDKMDCIH